MSKKQKFISIFLVIFALLLVYVPSAMCGNIVSKTEAKDEITGEAYYTTANIWYENASKIYSTNYHRGAILPVGTRVTIKKIRGDKIQFVDEEGQSFKIIFLKKHSNKRIDIWAYFDQYFSKKNPMRKGGPFQKFSKDEKDNIKMGEIAVGMSKAAVLMSYGYPPSHRTPSLESTKWIYWINRFVNRPVYFKDGKVSKWR